MNRMERILAGCEKYKYNFDRWKSDVSKFASDDFSKKLHSTDELEFNEAIEEIAIWGTSSSLTGLFCQTWGNDKKNRQGALECLERAKEKTTEEYLMRGLICLIDVAKEEID